MRGQGVARRSGDLPPIYRMPPRSQLWKLALLAIVLGVAIFGVVRWRRSLIYTSSEMLATLPEGPATLVYIDAKALREGGILKILAGSKAAEEPDYRKFVEQTGFDYQRDLDAVAASFAGGNEYFALRGRFDWNRLAGYARAEGGQCRERSCTMPASTPDRSISFHPLNSSVLAMAVSKDGWAVERVAQNQSKTAHAAPSDPVWISVPAANFANADNFPAGTQTFLAPLAQARNVTFAAGPQGDHLQIRMDVACVSLESAAELATRFTAATDLLKKMIEREHQTANPRDLSGVLVSGSFVERGSSVVGTWPIERGFVENLASGGVQ